MPGIPGSRCCNTLEIPSDAARPMFDRERVLAGRPDRPAGFAIPQAGDPVGAAGQQGPAVGADHHRRDGVGVGHGAAAAGAGSGIPQPEFAAHDRPGVVGYAAPGDDGLAVRRERDRVDPPGVRQGRAQRPAGRRVPQAGISAAGVVQPAGDEPCAVGAERDGCHDTGLGQ
jgi:hypothetical protein